MVFALMSRGLDPDPYEFDRWNPHWIPFVGRMDLQLQKWNIIPVAAKMRGYTQKEYDRRTIRLVEHRQAMHAGEDEDGRPGHGDRARAKAMMGRYPGIAPEDYAQETARRLELRVHVDDIEMAKLVMKASTLDNSDHMIHCVATAVCPSCSQRLLIRRIANQAHTCVGTNTPVAVREKHFPNLARVLFCHELVDLNLSTAAELDTCGDLARSNALDVLAGADIALPARNVEGPTSIWTHVSASSPGHRVVAALDRVFSQFSNRTTRIQPNASPSYNIGGWNRTLEFLR